MSRAISTRSRRSIALVFVTGLYLLLLGQVTFAQTPVQNDVAAAREILALVNEWRMQEALWPLQTNPTLEAMAIAQASYILPRLADLPDHDESAFHMDANGQNPRERAANSPYNWPSYGQLQQMEVGENAGVGGYKFVMNFWKTSDIHRRAALSNVYREVGVAAFPYNGNYFYLMDFGARPGVMTALLDSSGSTIYLSNENSKYTGITPGNMTVRVFDSDGKALTGTQPWTPTITFEQRLNGSMFVLFSNITFQALTEVDLSQDMALLPGNLDAVVAQAVITTPALADLVTSAPPTIAPTLASFAFPTNTPAAPPALAAIPSTTTADLLVQYTEHTLVIYNNASQPVNLNGLSVGSDNPLTVERWSTVASFSSDAFPVGSCLMVSEAGSSPATPTNCKFVRSQLEVSPSRAFWKTGPFTVNQNGTVLATCQVGASPCAVDLP
jgi:uncharacterized protein YkwD